LQVVCAATRPLSVAETFIAISIDEDDRLVKDLDVKSEDFSKKMIRNLCGLFVSVIDGRDYLLHQTAKEFLMAPETHQNNLAAGFEQYLGTFTVRIEVKLCSCPNLHVVSTTK